MMVHKKRDEPIIADEVPSTIDDAFPDIDENVVGLDEQKEAGGHILMDFKCEVCGKTFRHQGSLKRHLRDHDNVKTIICNMCDLKFKRMDNLYAHKRMVHNAHKINFDVLRNEANDLFHARCVEYHLKIGRNLRHILCVRFARAMWRSQKMGKKDISVNFVIDPINTRKVYLLI